MRVAIYSRKSVETDTGESIRNQIAFCKQYFERHGNCSFEIFEDEGFSGGNTNRPAFQRMMELVKMKQFDAVAVYKIDRIARNIVDFVNIYDELEKMNVKLVSVTEGFDPSTPVGKMMMLLLASFAEMERMNIAQRIRDNMKELGKLGRWSGGTPPSGYATKKVVINGKKLTFLEITDDAQNIRKIFKMYAEGYTTYQISKYFSSIGLNYPQKTIINILTNPTYLESSKEAIEQLKGEGYTVFGEPNGCGFLPYNRRPKINGKKICSTEKFVAVSQHKAIIDVKLWAAVQRRLKECSINPHPKESNFSWLSGGIIRCKCGKSMILNPGHRKKDGSRYYYFICKPSCGGKSIRSDRAEKHILNFFEKIITEDKLEDYLNINKDKKDVEKEIKAVNSKIARNSQAIDNLINKLMLLSNDAAVPVAQKIEELTKENINLKEKLLYFQREQLFAKKDDENINVLKNNILLFLREDMSVEDRRRLLRQIVEYIEWDSDLEELRVKFLL